MSTGRIHDDLSDSGIQTNDFLFLRLLALIFLIIAKCAPIFSGFKSFVRNLQVIRSFAMI